MGCECGTHRWNGREDVVAVSAETPNDDGAQRGHHHPDGVLRVGLVTHHANQQQRNKNTTEAVDGQHHEGEHGVAKAGELLSAKRNEGDEHGDDHRDQFRGFVLLSPLGLDVVGDGRRAGQHLAVGRRHGGGKDGSEDHTGQEGIEYFHRQQR